jgi:hypothetical protein
VIVRFLSECQSPSIRTKRIGNIASLELIACDYSEASRLLNIGQAGSFQQSFGLFDGISRSPHQLPYFDLQYGVTSRYMLNQIEYFTESTRLIRRMSLR